MVNNEHWVLPDVWTSEQNKFTNVQNKSMMNCLAVFQIVVSK